MSANSPSIKAAPARTAGSALRDTLLDAGIAGVIALVLAIPLLSHRTVQGAQFLELESRWGLALAAALVVFVGRLLLRALLWRQPGATPSRTLRALLAPLGQRFAVDSRWIGPALAGLAVVLPFFLASNHHMLDLSILVLTYVMLGWGLNIVVGLAGLLDLGYVAFYAVGAYSYALLSTHFGWSFWICLPLAGVLAAFWGILLGFPVLRLRGDYLAIVTLAFGEIIRIVITNWQDLTGGPNGITDIPQPTLFGLRFADPDTTEGTFAAYFGLAYSPAHAMIFLYYIILALALLTSFVTTRLRRQPIGRAWEALREDEIACRALGINTTTTKLAAFSIGAMFGGFAGSFFATRQESIFPESFVFMESAMILAIVVLGGMGSQIGIVLSAIVMIGGIEMLRNLDFLKAVFGPEFDPGQYRMLIFGFAMVLIMIWRPRGLISTRQPSVVLKERKSISGDMVQEGHG
ncbi:MAG: high-affinity branched-chain amino acid ABC transporter permease LivM [Hyphomicrobiaceae bacterium]